MANGRGAADDRSHRPPVYGIDGAGVERGPDELTGSPSRRWPEPWLQRVIGAGTERPVADIAVFGGVVAVFAAVAIATDESTAFPSSWIPGGFALAILLLTDASRWARLAATVAVVGAVIGVVAGRSLALSVALSLIGAAQALAATGALRVVAPGAGDLRRPFHVVALFAVGVVAMPFVGAVLEAGAFAWFGDVDASVRDRILAMFAFDALRTAIVCPVVLLFASRRRPIIGRRIELVVAAVVAVAVAVAVSNPSEVSAGAAAVVAPLLFGVLLWPGLRLGRLWATVVTVAAGLVIVTSTRLDRGVFAGVESGNGDRVALLAAFVGGLIFGQLVVSTTVAQRVLATNQAYDALARVEQHAARIERSNESLSEFNYVISHDLAAPVRAIGGFVDLLRQRYGDELDVRALGFIDRIEEASVRMKRMIDDVLDHARTGVGPDDLTPVDLGACLDAAIGLLGDEIDDTGARIEVVTPLPVVLAVSSQVERLFSNLLSNALKYRREDVSPVIEISATRSSGVGAASWVIDVADNGVGIPADRRERALRMFQRLNTDDATGTGIGLSISKKVVEAHGGTLRLGESEAGGLLVRFTLPVTHVGMT